MKIFIADDSKTLRCSLVDLLLDIPGVTIAGEAGDVEHAIDGIIATIPDAVILDLKMPGGSGLDVLASIKRMSVAPWVVVFTQYPFPEYRRRCMNAGAAHFFEKGADNDKLFTAVAARARECAEQGANAG